MSHGDTAKSPIRVLMAGTSYPKDADDWKGRFIHDLAAALGQSPALRLAFWGPPGDLPEGVRSASAADARWLDEMLAMGGIAHLLRRRPLQGLVRAGGILRRLRRAGITEQPDVYHLNWLQLALGISNDRRPAYVSVLGTDFQLLRLPGMKLALRRAFARHPTILAPNAHWMREPLETAFGDLADVRPNPFGVDERWFHIERQTPAVPTWLLVSRITRHKLGDLFEWGEGLFGEHRRLVLLGPMQEEIALPDWVDYQGSTDPAALRERWFPRASGLLTLSRHAEGRPQVMIEAMAAGLPVVASRLPAHDDLLQDGRTGWLPDSPRALRDALKTAEQAEIGARIGNDARMWIKDNIGTWADHADRCLDAYRTLQKQGPVDGR